MFVFLHAFFVQFHMLISLEIPICRPFNLSNKGQIVCLTNKLVTISCTKLCCKYIKLTYEIMSPKFQRTAITFTKASNLLAERYFCIYCI